MTTPAPDLASILRFAQPNIYELQVTADLSARLTTWLSAFSTVGSQTEAERTVKNWEIPTRRILPSIPTGVGSSDLAQTSTVIDIVYRTGWAAFEADQRGDINAAQAQDIVDAFNAAWT